MSEAGRVETGGGNGVTLSAADQRWLKDRQAERKLLSRRQLLTDLAVIAGVAGLAIVTVAGVSYVLPTVLEIVEGKYLTPDQKAALELFRKTKEEERLKDIEVIAKEGINLRYSPEVADGVNNYAGNLPKGSIIPEGILYPKKGYDPTDGNLGKQEIPLEWVAFVNKVDKNGQAESVLFFYPKTDASSVDVVKYTKPLVPTKP